MKNKKWLTYTLGTLLTLVVLAVVGGAGFRIGMMQGASNRRPIVARSFIGGRQIITQGDPQNNGKPQTQQGNSQNNGVPQGMPNFRTNGGNRVMQPGNFRYGWAQAMPGNFRGQGFINRGVDQRGGHMPFFFFSIFGLIRLVILAVILWLVYMVVKLSGWRLTRVQASPVPVASKAVEAEEKKESE